MKKLTIALAVAGLLGSGLAMAGTTGGGTTCADAQQVFPSSPYSGDTSAPGYMNNTNSFGGVPSPANDAYFYFISDGQATTTVSVTAQYNSGLALTSSCGNNSSLLRANGANAGTPYTVTIDNGAGAPLTAGTQYWLIMTGIPTGTSADNGPFTFNTPTPLPVTLQSFSID